MSRKQLVPHSFFGGSRINSIHFLKQSIYCFLLNVMLVECCTSVSVDRNIQLVTIWPGVLEHHPLISWLSKCFPHDMRCCITVFGPAQTQGTTNPMFYHGHPQLHSVVLRWFEVWGIHELWATKCTSSMNLSPLYPHSCLGIVCDLSSQARTFLGMNPRVAQKLRWTSCEVASVYVTPPLSRRCTMPLQRPNVATRCHWRTETQTCHRETTMIGQVFIFRT